MVTLWNGYALDADEYCIILGKPTEEARKDGTTLTTMRNATYHSTLSKALRAFYEKQVRETINNGAHTLSGALREAEGIERRIRELAMSSDFGMQA